MADRRFHHRAICGLLLVLAGLPTASWAALRPDAQAIADQGLAAAGRGDWVQAVDRFTAARKLAPEAPELFGYLGLAESKMPGRELRAISWFGAYLAADPHAANAIQVKQAIAELEHRNTANLDRLVQIVRDASSNTPQNLPPIARLYAEANDPAAAEALAVQAPTPAIHDEVEQRIAESLAGIGESAAAERSMARIGDPLRRFQAARIVAEAFIRDKDVAGALRIEGVLRSAATKIPGGGPTEHNFGIPSDGATVVAYEIEILQANRADVAGARASIDRIDNPYLRCDAWEVLAGGQTKAHDLATARSALGVAVGLIPQVPSADARAALQIRLATVAVVQAMEGDTDGARATVALIAASDLDADSKAQVAAILVPVQIAAGDPAGARQSATMISDPRTRDPILEDIGVGYLKGGDVAGAQQLLAVMDPAGTSKVELAYDIALAQSKAKDFAGAAATVAGMSDDYLGSARLVAEAAARSGDLEEAKRVLGVRGAAIQPGDLALVEALAGQLGDAQQIVDTMPQGLPRIRTEVAVAVAKTKAGDLSGASADMSRVEIEAGSMAPGSDADNAWHEIAMARAGLGDSAGARAVLVRMTNVAQRAVATAEAAATLQEANQPELAQAELAEATTLLANLPVGDTSDEAWFHVASTIAKQGDAPGAASAARHISNPLERTSAHVVIAGIALDAGDRTDADEVLRVTANELYLIGEDSLERGRRQEIDALDVKYHLRPPDSLKRPTDRVSRWTRLIDTLQGPMFLDMVGYVQALPRGDASKTVDSLIQAIDSYVSPSNAINLLLREDGDLASGPA